MSDPVSHSSHMCALWAFLGFEFCFGDWARPEVMHPDAVNASALLCSCTCCAKKCAASFFPAALQQLGFGLRAAVVYAGSSLSL